MDSVTNSVNSRSSGGAEHGRHDRLLVSRFGAGDAFPSEQDEARALVARCSDCARLAADISALRAATTALPAPPRPRDFRLSADQADKLRGSTLQRWLRRLAAPGLAPVRPLAGVALSIGLVLMVAGVALPSPAAELMAIDQAGANGVPENVGVPSRDATDAPGASGPPEAGYGGPGAVPVDPTGAEDPRFRDGDDLEAIGLDGELEQAESTRQLLITSGLILGVLSLGILVLVVFARRRAADPLLR